MAFLRGARIGGPQAARRGWWLLVLSLLMTAGGQTVTTARAQDEATAKRKPFFPSSQTTPDGKTVALKDYAKNEDCMRCHKEIGKQWQGSMHSGAVADPVFQILCKLGSQETKGLTDKLCLGCHSSPMVVTGDATPEAFDGLAKPASDGVSCVVCHSITKSNRGPDEAPQNASFVTDPAGPVVGANGDRPCRATGKKTMQSDLHHKSEFCANCHGVVHPVNGFVVERTYDEWRSSIYAAKGIQCQDCHMQPVEKAIETARTLERVPNPGKLTSGTPQRKHVYSHEFIGASSTMTALMGSKEHSQMSERLLKSAASLQLQMKRRASPGRLVELRVKVTNETAGHNLPTSLVEVRQMWLDVEVTDATEKVLYRSGALDENGTIDKNAVVFHAIAADAKGKPTVKPWEMTSFLYFHTIPPKGYTLERYAFVVPGSAKGPIKVKATLRYRSFPQLLANQLLGEGAPTIPVVDMTSAQKEIELVVPPKKPRKSRKSGKSAKSKKPPKATQAQE